MSYFVLCLGSDSYTPVRYGQHEGAHPQRVREALTALKGTPHADVIAALVKRVAANECMRAELGPDLAELQRLRSALENCRLLAGRSRTQDWAAHILRFCAQAGVGGSPLRDEAKARQACDRGHGGIST